MRIRGQPVAESAVRAMLRGGMPHALLLAGPAGVGKTTLALDIAAALLCQGALAGNAGDDAAGRPCGECRSCRMVAHGNHPDLHRLAPAGPGSLISIGGRDERGVRDLVSDLALLPVEGGARVAIVEGAHRMSEDAQSAFLKTLEEPPAGTTIVLCADDEDRLLPTIRSRCARVRLGPMGPRDVEAILAEAGVADAPTANRLSRLAEGRPGRAIAYARAPEAVTIRAEIARTLLDLRSAGSTARLAGIRDLATRAGEMVAAIDAGAARADAAAGIATGSPTRGSRARGRGRGRSDGGAADETGAPPDAPSETPAEGRTARIPAAERRRAALALLQVWSAVLRDLGSAVAGQPGSIRDRDLGDDLVAAADRIRIADVGAGLGRLDVAAERLEGNVSPELVLDVLALAWAPAAA